MEIRKRFRKDIAIVYVEGKIDVDSASLIEETGGLVKEGYVKILCSFANVDIVDYNGLSIMAIAYKNVTNQGGVLKFCDVPAHIRELFKVARLDGVFELYPDEELALQSFEATTRIDSLSLRRRFKRIDIGVPVRYKAGLSSDESFSEGKILNLSAAGAFVQSKHTLPVPTELYMEIALNKARPPLAIMGKVVWLADKQLQPHAYPGMGIGFANLSKATEEAIIDFIDKNLTKRSRAQEDTLC